MMLSGQSHHFNYSSKKYAWEINKDALASVFSHLSQQIKTFSTAFETNYVNEILNQIHIVKWNVSLIGVIGFIVHSHAAVMCPSQQGVCVESGNSPSVNSLM